jgi:hypothetical protein
MTHDKTGILEWISTAPEFNNSEMLTAICCGGIDHLLKNGTDIITLTTEETGIPFYKSLGFEKYYDVIT